MLKKLLFVSLCFFPSACFFFFFFFFTSSLLHQSFTLETGLPLKSNGVLPVSFVWWPTLRSLCMGIQWACMVCVHKTVVWRSWTKSRSGSTGIKMKVWATDGVHAPSGSFLKLPLRVCVTDDSWRWYDDDVWMGFMCVDGSEHMKVRLCTLIMSLSLTHQTWATLLQDQMLTTSSFHVFDWWHVKTNHGCVFYRRLKAVRVSQRSLLSF